MTFEQLGLAQPIVKAVADQGYTSPTPIQQQAIPVVLAGCDLMAAAQTGTGKTAAFTLPLLHKLLEGEQARSNQARALVLTPTRELAAQVAANVASYSHHTPLRSCVVFGGVKINPQMMKLRRGADILIATPGRLLDLYQQNAVKFDDLEMLVLDEADRMLDMGFIHDIKRILRVLPKRRQNLLFSATFSDEIRNLASSLVNNPAEVSVTPRNSTAKRVKQCIYPVDKKRKAELLCHLMEAHQWKQVLVFCRTKHGANRLTRQLDNAGFKALAIHGNKSQGARTTALKAFKERRVDVLVATDIAARGIDIDQLPHVVNFDLPSVAEDYVHRIGRTGRAGAVGEAVSLVSADEFKQLSDIEILIKTKIERVVEDGFEPNHDLPESSLNRQPRRASKPKARNNTKNNHKNNSKKNNNKKSSSQKNSSQRSNSQSSSNKKSNSQNAKPKTKSSASSPLASSSSGRKPKPSGRTQQKSTDGHQPTERKSGNRPANKSNKNNGKNANTANTSAAKNRKKPNPSSGGNRGRQNYNR